MSIINCAPSGPDFFSYSGDITINGWTNLEGIYTYAITLFGVDEYMSVISFDFTNNSQVYQTATIQWETQENKVILTTTSLPTGTLSYNMIVAG